MPDVESNSRLPPCNPKPLALLVIHVPILLFAMGALLAATVVWHGVGGTRWIAGAAAWWCTAGAVMQTIEAPGRRQTFCRLYGMAGRYPPGLHHTLCGVLLLWALRIQRAGAGHWNAGFTSGQTHEERS